MDFAADLAGLARHPHSTLLRIDGKRRLSMGLVSLLLAFGLPLLAAELTAIHPYRPPTDLGSLPAEAGLLQDVFDRWSYQQRFLLPIVIGLGGLILWVLAALFIHLLARALGGRGGFIDYLKLAGYISVLGLLGLPFNLLVSSLDLRPASSLVFAIGLGLFFWQNLLLIAAAQVHYGISTGKAVGAVVGPVGCLGALLLVLAVVMATVAVAVAGGGL